VLLAGVVALALGTTTGCGLDCSGQSIPHCPYPGGAECVNGGWYCVGFDLSGAVAPDFSSPRDLTSTAD
jgi:hypothetical protein